MLKQVPLKNGTLFEVYNVPTINIAKTTINNTVLLHLSAFVLIAIAKNDKLTF